MFQKNKKKILIVMILALLISAIPVSADNNIIYDPEQSIYQTQVDGDNKYIFYNFPSDGQFSVSAEPSMDSLYVSSTLDYAVPRGSEKLNIVLWPLGEAYSGKQELTGGAVDVSSFKTGGVLGVKAKFNMSIDYVYNFNGPGSGSVKFACFWTAYWYDEDGGYLRDTSSSAVPHIIELTNPGTSADVGNRYVAMDLFADIEIPELAAYMVPRIKCAVYLPDGSETNPVSVQNITISSRDFLMTVKKNILLEQTDLIERLFAFLKSKMQASLDNIDKDMDDVKFKLDDLLDLPNKLKNQASGSGNDSVDRVTDAFPDKSAGFLEGFQNLASAMSYEGTDASLTFPSIKIPALPGLFPEYVLSPEYPVDFGYWVSVMPEQILSVARILLTLALIGYCFKEFYSMIAYAMTLKGGGSIE